MNERFRSPTYAKVIGGENVPITVRANMTLTPEQEAYCRARAMGMSVQEAWRATGTELSLSKVKKWEVDLAAVRMRIEELSAIASKNAILKTGLDREWVIRRLMSVVDRCMQAEPVVNSQGEETGAYKFDSSGANQALKMLGDTLGMFKPQERKPEDDYANLSDDDLARIAAELASQVGLLAHSAGAQAASGPQQAIEVQAVPEAEGIPRLGEDEAGEAVPGGQPVGQGASRRHDGADAERVGADRVPEGWGPGDCWGRDANEGGGGVSAGHQAAVPDDLRQRHRDSLLRGAPVEGDAPGGQVLDAMEPGQDRTEPTVRSMGSSTH
jgi:phage terminase small subunit